MKGSIVIEDRDPKKKSVSAFLTHWEVSNDYATQYVYITDEGHTQHPLDEMPVTDYTDEEIEKIAIAFIRTESFYQKAIRSKDEDLEKLLELSKRYFTLALRLTQDYIKNNPFYRNIYNQKPIMLANRDFLTKDAVFLEFFDRMKAREVSEQAQKYFLTFLNPIDQVSRMTNVTRVAFEILTLRADTSIRAMLAHQNSGFDIQPTYRMWQNVPFVQPNTVH